MPSNLKGSFLLVSFFLAGFFSCGLSQEILGLSQKEAANRLKDGDLGFILEADLPGEFPVALEQLGTITRLNPDALFYAGLISEYNASLLQSEALSGTTADGTENTVSDDAKFPGKETIARSLLFYAAALESESIPVRREAAEKLILPCLETENAAFVMEVLSRLKPLPRSNLAPAEFARLKAACLYRLGRFDDLAKLAEGESGDGWEKTIPFLGALRNLNRSRQEAGGSQSEWEKTVREVKNFFFDVPLTRELLDAGWEWGLKEIMDFAPDFFSPGEELLLQGRAAVARSAYGQGVRFFRQVVGDSRYPAEIYIFPHPELITSVGRAFQYGGSQTEGSRLLNGWIEAFPKGTLSTASSQASYYRLLHYAGRIERQRERYDDSNAIFMAAAHAAPDALERDACIWYVIRDTLTEKPENAAALVKELIPLMSSPPYFTDVMERLSRQLTANRQWDTMLELFDALKTDHHTAASQFAWILGRVIQEGRFESDRLPEDFFKVALEKGNTSIYYRAMSASKLNVPLIPVEAAGETAHGASVRGSKSADNTSNRSRSSKSNRNSVPDPVQQETKFILDFFEYKAERFVLPYVRKTEGKLPFSDLRKIAKALGDYGRRGDSLSLVSRYMDREDYELDREDLLLFYPRHFQELIERNAKKAGFGAEILFGLVRTESAFMPEAVSRVGAMGLGQFMPATALEVAARIAQTEGIDYRVDGKIDLRNPIINAHMSANYFRFLIDQLGSPMPAILAYNGGIGRIRRWRNAAQLPDDLFLETVDLTETRGYGRKVLATAAMYGWLYYGMSMEAVVADIYR